MKPSLVEINHATMVVSIFVDECLKLHPEDTEAVTQFLERIQRSRAELHERIYGKDPLMQE